MIAMLSGEIRHLALPQATLLTESGVGYELELPLSSFCHLLLGERVTLWVHMMVREDAHTLYAFVERQDRDAFRKLIKINGVGAKMALAMLSAMRASELHHCIESANEAQLVRIPGVGKKTAQRLIIELKGKLNEFADAAVGISDASMPTALASSEMVVLAEVESALVGLGYKEKEAQNAIASAKQGMTAINTQGLLKATLKQLAKQSIRMER